MRSVVAAHQLLPKGLELESLSLESGHVSIWAGSGARRCLCPLCGHVSSRVHSRYVRTVSDLPWHGICVTFKVRARRFFCEESSCERKIFCERLERVAARARKTDRLEEALLAIALELGGRAGARLALELGIVAARDTLLRRVKGASLPEVGKVRVLGVDDFAFKKGTTYGTILVNLEDHKVVDLLPERSQESLLAWFGSHPDAGVEVASRDRSNIYREGLAKGAPGATHVAAAKLAGTCSTTSRWKSTCSRSGRAGGGTRGKRRRRGLRFRADHAEPSEDARSEDRRSGSQEA
jgi:transposase